MLKSLFRDRHKRRGGNRNKSTADRHKTRQQLPVTRPFIGIDGEGGGVDDLGRQNYLLLCASDRDGGAQTLFKDNAPLTAADCFDFILSLPKEADIVGYLFNHDITRMLRQHPEERINRIFNSTIPEGKPGPGLKRWTHWGKYAIKWLPNHNLKIGRSEQYEAAPGVVSTRSIPETVRTVYEVKGFFQCTFEKALADWNVGTSEERALIARNKKLRPDFEKM